MRLSVFLALFLGMLPVSVIHASEDVPQAVIQTATQYLPGFKSENAKLSGIPGLYQVEFESNIVYMSADGRYIVRGDVIDVEGGVNLTETARKGLRTDAIEALGEDSMIVFEPKEVRGTITVFTDITCPYCAKLHREVAQLNQNGIRVRYLAFPRAGVPSSVADDMASIWCADDRQKALTDAKLGVGVQAKNCPNPVREHYETGNTVGVNGTPAIVLEDGTLVAGYVPAMRLTDSAIQARDAVLQ